MVLNPILQFVIKHFIQNYIKILTLIDFALKIQNKQILDLLNKYINFDSILYQYSHLSKTKK